MYICGVSMYIYYTVYTLCGFDKTAKRQLAVHVANSNSVRNIVYYIKVFMTHIFFM